MAAGFSGAAEGKFNLFLKSVTSKEWLLPLSSVRLLMVSSVSVTTAFNMNHLTFVQLGNKLTLGVSFGVALAKTPTVCRLESTTPMAS